MLLTRLASVVERCLTGELLCGESTGRFINLGHLRELHELDTLSTSSSTIYFCSDSSLNNLRSLKRTLPKGVEGYA